MYHPTIQGYSIKFQRLGLFLMVEGLKFHQHVVIFSQGSIFLKTNVEDTVPKTIESLLHRLHLMGDCETVGHPFTVRSDCSSLSLSTHLKTNMAGWKITIFS